MCVTTNPVLGCGLLTPTSKGFIFFKIKILSLFTQVVSNLYEFLSSSEHKKMWRYFEECGELMYPIDFHSILFFLFKKSMGYINCLVRGILL